MVERFSMVRGIVGSVLSSLWDYAHKRPLAVNKKRVGHVVAASGFLSRFLNESLPYLNAI